MKINRVDVVMSLAVFAVAFGVFLSVVAPIEQTAPRSAPAEVTTADSLRTFYNETRRELRDGWRGIFGEMQGTSYQLYATMGNADTEAMQAYYAARGTEDVDRVFSDR